MVKLFTAGRSLVVAGIGFLHTGCVFAESNEFLKYQEPKPQVSVLSGIDTMLYMVTVFILILGLAYLTSRFVGMKMKSQQTGSNGDTILSSLALGPNKGIYLVHFAGRVLVLGVSDQRIDVLADMTDNPEVAELKAAYQAAKPVVAPQFSAVLDSQLASLRQMSNKFPRVFGKSEHDLNSESEEEKR